MMKVVWMLPSTWWAVAVYEDKAKLLCAACLHGNLGVLKELVEQDKVDPKSECYNLLCF